MKLIIKRDLLVALGFILSFFLCFFYLYLNNLNFLILYSLMPFLFLLLYNKEIPLKKTIFVSFVFLLFLFEVFFFSSYFRKEEAILWLWIAYSSFFYSYFLYKNIYRIEIGKILFFLYSGFIWYFILIYGVYDIEIYNNIFEGYSRNVLSAIMIFLTLNLILSYYQEGKNVPFGVYIICFLTCVFLLGRSGIIISTILLFYHSFLCYKKRYTLFFVLILSFIYFYYFDQILNLLDENSNFKNGLESPRTVMVNEYLLNIFYDENQLFWGRNYLDCCSTVVAHNGNIHNSFLSGHAKYGILHTFFIILILVYLLLSKKIFLIFIGTLILVRYYYDQLGFFGIYDITFFYLLLLSRFKKEAF